MAEGGEKRSKTSHRTPSQIKRHGRTFQASPTQKKNRAKRNAARATMQKEGRVSKGDKKDVHHKKPLKKGGTNARRNLSVMPRSKNRART